MPVRRIVVHAPSVCPPVGGTARSLVPFACCRGAGGGARLRRQSRLDRPFDPRTEAHDRSMALPLPVIPPQPDAFHLAPHRIKRCTFRRLINVEMGARAGLRRRVPLPGPQGPDPPRRPRGGDADLQRLRRASHLPPRRGLTAGCRAASSSGRPRRRSIGRASARRSVSRVLSRSGAGAGPGMAIHLGPPVARRLMRPTRGLGSAPLPRRRSPAAGCALLFGLAPGGVCPFHSGRRLAPSAGIVTVALVLASRRAGVTRHPALRSSDFPHAADGSPRRRRAAIRPPR